MGDSGTPKVAPVKIATATIMTFEDTRPHLLHGWESSGSLSHYLGFERPLASSSVVTGEQIVYAEVFRSFGVVSVRTGFRWSKREMSPNGARHKPSGSFS